MRRNIFAAVLACASCLVCVAREPAEGKSYKPSMGAPRPGLEIRAACWRPANDSIHLLVYNNSHRARPIGKLMLNGTDLVAHHDELPPARGCRWYRIWPHPVPPGRPADVTISLLNTDVQQFEVVVEDDGGARATATVRKQAPGAYVCGLYFSPDLRTLHVYLRAEHSAPVRRNARIVGVRVNGTKPRVVRAFDRLYRGAGYLQLAIPPAAGQPHVVEVDVERTGGAAVTVFACVGAFYVPSVLGTYGNFSENYQSDYASHGLNHYLGFHAPGRDSLDSAAKYGLKVGGSYGGPQVDRKNARLLELDDATRERIRWLRNHPAYLYTQLIDEPDCADYSFRKSVGGNYFWSCGAVAPHLLERIQWLHEQDPRHFVLIQIDHTFRPYNWMSYSELCDVPAGHSYSLGKPGGLEAILNLLRRLKACAEPRPFYAVLQFTPVPIGAAERFPAVEEMAWQQYAALAAGAKGAIYYIHSGSRNRAGHKRELWDGMAPLHRELAALHDVRYFAEPVDWARSALEGVEATALLAGERAVIIVLLDRQCDSSPQGFRAPKRPRVECTLDLPPWLRLRTLRRLAEDKALPVPFTRKGTRYQVVIDELRAGTVVVGELERGQ